MPYIIYVILFYIGVLLIYHAVSVSGGQQSDSVMCVYMYIYIYIYTYIYILSFLDYFPI